MSLLTQLNWPILSALIWLPIIGGTLVLLLGDRPAKWLSLLLSTATLALSGLVYAHFALDTAQMQFTESHVWVQMFNIDYALGVDGISLPLVLLTALITPLVVIAGWRVITDRPAVYMGACLIMSGLMIGVFLAMDAVLFYVFWEASLIPMLLLIGIWGGAGRIRATIKFFLYTLLGSVFMLVALVYLYHQAQDFDLIKFHNLPLSLLEQQAIFLAFLFAFAVKIPMWPVHTWLPDAHVEAPTGGSVVLAAIMLKMGGYGLIRLSLPIAPDASYLMAQPMIVLSLIAIVYIALVALVQQDMKKLIAYSSISHMGIVTLGVFVTLLILLDAKAVDQHTFGAAMLAAEGAMVQMISHGLISAGLFLCVGVLYERLHTRNIADYGGVASSMPRFATLVVLFAMANVGLPGTSGFVGEFMVIIASFKAQPLYAFIAALTLILGAAYTLWMVKRVIFGEASNSVSALADIGLREWTVLAILAALILLLGFWPHLLTQLMHPSVEQLLYHIMASKVPLT